ncbi:MAG: hypothetical protein M3Q72_11365 [Actinomycetota bacterium]|nr:hypothetical protein [Actinomycetota bacterium]
MGELHAPRDVADRPDAPDRGCHRVVGDDRTTLVDLDADLPQSEPVTRRSPSGRDEELGGGDR